MSFEDVHNFTNQPKTFAGKFSKWSRRSNTIFGLILFLTVDNVTDFYQALKAVVQMEYKMFNVGSIFK